MDENLNDNSESLTAQQFHQWILEKENADGNTEYDPGYIGNATIDRLKKQKETLEQTVIYTVNACINFEFSSNGNKLPVLFTDSIKTISNIIPLLVEKESLKAKLLIKKAELLVQEGLLDKAVKTCEETLEILNNQHYSIDMQRINCMLLTAGLWFSEGNKQQCEKYCLDILSYPWYLVSEAVAFQQLREYYLEAAKKLIECRRGDLQQLRNIFFVPAVNDILKPFLSAAIEEAEKNEQDE
jgi:hypothetical protein